MHPTTSDSCTPVSVASAALAEDAETDVGDGLQAVARQLGLEAIGPEPPLLIGRNAVRQVYLLRCGERRYVAKLYLTRTRTSLEEDVRFLRAWLRFSYAARILTRPLWSADEQAVFPLPDGRHVIFFEYHEDARRLNAITSDEQVERLAEVFAEHHRAASEAAISIYPGSGRVEEGLGALARAFSNPAFLEQRRLDRTTADVLARETDRLQHRLHEGAFGQFPLLPVLLDMNRTNFAVTPDGAIAKVWDYDFIMRAPAIFDFYMWSQVAAGTDARRSLLLTPQSMWHPGFKRFLATYLAHRPMSRQELELTFESYRYLLLYFGILHGPEYFRGATATRLVGLVVQHFAELHRHDPKEEFAVAAHRARLNPGERWDAIIAMLARRLRETDERWIHLPRSALDAAARREIFDLYQRAYGAHKFFRNAEDLPRGRRQPGLREFWDYYEEAFVLRESGGTAGAFCLGRRTDLGLKLSAAGANTDRQNRRAVLESIRRSNLPGVYFELSSALAEKVGLMPRPQGTGAATLARGSGATAIPIVNPRLVAPIKGVDDFKLEPDGAHYQRTITFVDSAPELCRKVMVGWPQVPGRLLAAYDGALHALTGPGFAAACCRRKIIEEAAKPGRDRAAGQAEIDFILAAAEQTTEWRPETLDTNWRAFERFLDEWHAQQVCVGLLDDMRAGRLDPQISGWVEERSRRSVVCDASRLESYARIATGMSAARRSDPVLQAILEANG